MLDQDRKECLCLFVCIILLLIAYILGRFIDCTRVANFGIFTTSVSIFGTPGSVCECSTD